MSKKFQATVIALLSAILVAILAAGLFGISWLRTNWWTQATYVFTTQLYNEATGRELSTSQCSRETADGEPYDNVPYATYSLLDSTRNIIGIMKPVGNVGDCTFEYELTTGEVSDLLLIQGPRMQQNGFPASEDDWYEREDGAIVIAELSLGVTP